MSPNAPKFNDDQAKEIREKYEAGGSVEKLAKEYKTTASTVCRTIRRVGGTVRTRNYRTPGFNDEVSLVLRKKYEAGATLQQLVDEHGTHRTTISSAIQRAGGTLRRRGFEKDTRTWKKPTKGILSWL